MATNILKAVMNIKKYGKNDFSKIYPEGSEMSTYNRINNVGVSLEYFMKDSLCNTFEKKNKDLDYNKNFSYLGNKNNPPDLIIKGSDAIEVKKIGGNSTDIQLNSSYPKSKLFSDNESITQACRDCEDGWIEKDMVYAVGLLNKDKLKVFMMVYGDCYAASPEVYEKVKKRVTDGLHGTDLEFSETKELGRINRVDPLGITNLRIRGMWLIKNPLNVFANIVGYEDYGQKFSLITLMREEKYLDFPKEDRVQIEGDSEIQVTETHIKDPDNPSNLIKAVSIRYDAV